MRILLIDDDAAKRSRVRQALSDWSGDDGSSVREATTYEEALRALSNTYYDLVVLDLVLPAAGGSPSPETSRAIIREVLQGSAMIPPMHIIGLTAYPEVAADEEDFYEENLFALVLYSEVDTRWEDKLRSKIVYLNKSKQAASSFQANTFDYDVVVLTARYENEYRPVQARLFSTKEAEIHPRWKGRITTGLITVDGIGSLRTALCSIDEMGMAPAAAVASQAISIFRPKLVVMLGMCCGFSVKECSSPMKLLDTIVVREVNCWEEGKYVAIAGKSNRAEFRNRAKSRIIDAEIIRDIEGAVEAAVDTLEPAVRQLALSSTVRAVRKAFPDGFVRDLPEVHLGLLVSGSSVIAGSDVVLEIIERNPKAVGLDMEMYGVYSAVEKCVGRRPSILGIKGVADFGEVEKDNRAQRAASEMSTEVFKALLPHLSIWAQ